MDSHEVLKQTVERVGAKRVAAHLRVSSSLVYKWCEDDGEGDESQSGARNPLDRIVALMEATGDSAVIEWLCDDADGFFVRNPLVEGESFDAAFFAHTQKLVLDFSQLLATMSEAIANDGRVDGIESQDIRAQWQAMKQYGEAFVCACERGLFNPKK